MKSHWWMPCQVSYWKLLTCSVFKGCLTLFLSFRHFFVLLASAPIFFSFSLILQFYFMHMLLSESDYIFLLLNYFYILKKKVAFWKGVPACFQGFIGKLLKMWKLVLTQNACYFPALFGFCVSWDVQTVKCRSCCWAVSYITVSLTVTTGFLQRLLQS